ncbi:unnamed protein product [Microthlaspi erraticum]|uniref:Uncharacterized protein n=1 Tax=Microthlaspi erraticum TaxID=1685480 RepID=A0A6D2JLY2_9BRAS|nr:unnamed protein product [Microthlaspi erraticum]
MIAFLGRRHFINVPLRSKSRYTTTNWATFQIRFNSGVTQKVKCADYAIENIHNLKEALPELWESEAKPGKVRYSGKLPVETPVVA